MSRITYQKYVEQNPDPIKDLTGEVLQGTLYNWFKYRYLGFSDTEKFTDIFRRNIAVNIDMYNQKLRIQPGISQYDWLVQLYRERQLKVAGDDTTTRVHNSDRIDITESNTGFDTTTYDTTDTSDSTRIRQDDITVSTVNAVAKDSVEYGSKVTGTKSGNETHVKTGGHTDTKTEGLHTTSDSYVEGTHTTTSTPGVTEKVQHGGRAENFQNTQGVSANLPMSETYTHFTETPENNYVDSEENNGHAWGRAGLPDYVDDDGKVQYSLKWNNLSAQTQGFAGNYSEDKTNMTTTRSGHDSTSRQGSTSNPDKRTTTRQGNSAEPDTDSIVYNDETDTINYDVKDVSEKSGEDFTNKNDTTTTDTRNTYGNITDTGTNKKTGTDRTDHTGDHISNQKNSYGNITDTGYTSRTDREQVTGRNEDPATILARAENFIENSNAFIWLREQLDSCFAPWYNIDDDETDTVEGGVF